MTTDDLFDKVVAAGGLPRECNHASHNSVLGCGNPGCWKYNDSGGTMSTPMYELQFRCRACGATFIEVAEAAHGTVGIRVAGGLLATQADCPRCAEEGRDSPGLEGWRGLAELIAWRPQVEVNYRDTIATFLHDVNCPVAADGIARVLKITESIVLRHLEHLVSVDAVAMYGEGDATTYEWMGTC
jgi:hypothetical protein